MTKKMLYLAGGFYGEWKQQVKDNLSDGWTIIDPEDNVVIAAHFVTDDLASIDLCDAVLAFQDSYPYVYGMAAEIGYAVAKGKQVVYICTADRVDSFLAGLARATFTSIQAGVEFINRRL